VIFHPGLVPKNWGLGPECPRSETDHDASTLRTKGHEKKRRTRGRQIQNRVPSHGTFRAEKRGNKSHSVETTEMENK